MQLKTLTPSFRTLKFVINLVSDGYFTCSQSWNYLYFFHHNPIQCIPIFLSGEKIQRDLLDGAHSLELYSHEILNTFQVWNMFAVTDQNPEYKQETMTAVPQNGLGRKDMFGRRIEFQAWHDWAKNTTEPMKKAAAQTWFRASGDLSNLERSKPRETACLERLRLKTWLCQGQRLKKRD